MEGRIIPVKEVTDKKSDSLGKNSTGPISGCVSVAIAVASSSTVLAVGSGLFVSIVWPYLDHKLSKSKAFKYIIKVDISNLKSDYYEGSPEIRAAISWATTSGLITVLQGKDVRLGPNTKAYVIFSDLRVRVIPSKDSA